MELSFLRNIILAIFYFRLISLHIVGRFSLISHSRGNSMKKEVKIFIWKILFYLESFLQISFQVLQFSCVVALLPKWSGPFGQIRIQVAFLSRGSLFELISSRSYLTKVSSFIFSEPESSASNYLIYSSETSFIKSC